MYTFSESKRKMDLSEPLVSIEELLKICKELEDNDAPKDEIETHIMSAHIYLYHALDGRGIADELMKLIETYIAAHFAVLSYPAIESEALASLRTKYFGKVDLGLNATRYGQMAMQLDPTGLLGTDKKQAVVVKSIGSGVDILEAISVAGRT